MKSDDVNFFQMSAYSIFLQPLEVQRKRKKTGSLN
jgi:hypothetical protein